MKISSEGIALIKSRESCRLVAYLCPAGRWSIGYGHTGLDVHEGLHIDQFKAEMLLQGDLEIFDTHVQRVCAVSTTGQHSAMVSLCFNVGCDAFTRSSVARLHNARRFPEAAQAFALWNKVRGRVMPGLVARRAEETKLYLSDLSSDEVAPLGVERPQVHGENPLAASRTLSGGAVAATATSVTIASEAARQIGDWHDRFAELAPLFDELKWVLLGLTIAGIILSMYARISDRHEGRS